MENGHKPSDCPVSIAPAIYRDGGYSQSGASPRASSERPRPGGGVSLDVTENPSWDSRGEENHVDESFGDEVNLFPYLRDGDVAAVSHLPAVALTFRGGADFPTGDGGGTGSRGILSSCL